MMLTMNMINLFLFSSPLSFTSAQPLPRLHAPLNKDPVTSLYTILLNSIDPYVIDIAAPFSWRRCPSGPHPTVACFTAECTQAQYLPSPCPLPPTSSTTPCKCMVTPRNPITQSCAFAHLTYTNISDRGAHIFLKDIFLSCAPNPLFQSLPKGVVGLASLSLAPLSLQNQFSDRLPQLTRTFAMCLPSTSSRNGAMYFGNATTHSLLSYTPLLTNPKIADYAVGIKGLSVGKHSVTAMSPFEGIRLSTVVPYTTLATDVYARFVERFEEGMKGVPKMKSVPPFSKCYKASAISFRRVPRIDLEFDGGKNWTIFGANSMRRVGGDTACLAFLDGGEKAALKIVIGAFHMEDYLLVFDVDRSRFGFSSSLLSKGLSCSNFNFTT